MIEDSNMSEGTGVNSPEEREIARLTLQLEACRRTREEIKSERDAHAEVSQQRAQQIRQIEDVRDSWCAEFTKARNALKAIWDATDPYADGAVDASAHDKLCNEISSIARPWKDAQV